MSTVWVNGTFDVLHVGHIRLLKYASEIGKVTVGIDTDERVKQLKGSTRPFNSFEMRKEMLESLKYVDTVVSFSSDEELRQRIKDLAPDVMIVGDDYIGKNVIGSEHAGELLFFSKVPGLSTSKILKDKNTSYEN